MPALLLVLASACGEEPPPPEPPAGGEAPQRFVADLAPLNRSNVDGTARMTLDDNKLTVDLEAGGLEPTIHEQHIHGDRRGEREASCPGRDEDTDGDRFVDLGEGEATYGPGLFALEPFPTVNRSRRIDWDLTVNVDSAKLEPLERRVLLLRGRSADMDDKPGAEYVPDLPIACGSIEPLG